MQKILKTQFTTDESILTDIMKGGRFVQFQYASILPLGGNIGIGLCLLTYTIFRLIKKHFNTGGHIYCCVFSGAWNRPYRLSAKEMLQERS